MPSILQTPEAACLACSCGITRRGRSSPSSTWNNGGMVEARIAGMARRVLSGESLQREDAEALARVGGDDLYDLFYWANKIRIRFVGRDVKFCAIVAAKVGGCSEDCKFCAQSEHYHTAVGEQSKLSD